MNFVVNPDNASAKNIFFFKISLSISQDSFVLVPLGQLSSEVVRLIPLLVKKKAECGRKKVENFLKRIELLEEEDGACSYYQLSPLQWLGCLY